MKTKIFSVLLIILLICGCGGSGPDPSPDLGPPDPGPDPDAINHIILNVCYVTKEWIEFDSELGGGWTCAIVNKELHGVKFYEAAIWEDTMSIHLYAFPQDYVETQGPVAYRESFVIAKFDNMPDKRSGRGEFVLDVFSEFAQILVERHPDATHNLIYTGHGGPGEFFDVHLRPAEMTTLLSNWHSALGRKLGFVDMGGPCNKGSFHDLEAIHEHAEYYIASDLSVGCFTYDDWDSVDYDSLEALYQYPRILSSHEKLENALIERVNVYRDRYNAGKNNITNNQVMQSHYLYSCSEFAKHKTAITEFMESLSFNPYVGRADIRHEIARAGRKDLLEAFESIIVYGVDTRQYFTWPEENNGLFWSIYRDGPWYYEND